MSDPIHECVDAALKAFAERFLFRKLGICFDYAAEPGAFPRSTLPTARDVRDGIPSPTGIGSGIAHSARNGGIFFDTYLTRIEYGFAGGSDERILDRLIGGLIRTATVAPQGFLVRGLTPDGRGFYPVTTLDSHLMWAFSAWRGYHTPVIAHESQQKFRNITGKWMNRLESDDLQILTANGKPSSDGNTAALDWTYGPKRLALIAVAADLTKDVRLWELYLENFAEADNVRMTWTLPDEIQHPEDLQSVAVALRIIADIDEDETRRALVLDRLRDVALAAVPFVDAYKNALDPILEETPDLDWRAVIASASDAANTDSDTASENSPADFAMPTSWRRIDHEHETIGASFAAMMTLMLTNDADFLAPYVDDMTTALRAAAWDKIWLASSIASGVNAHARGMALGLWSNVLTEESLDLSACIPRVEVYLEDDYDDTHTDESGHTHAPKKRIKELIGVEKESNEGGRGRGRNRGRNRRNRNRNRSRSRNPKREGDTKPPKSKS